MEGTSVVFFKEELLVEAVAEIVEGFGKAKGEEGEIGEGREAVGLELVVLS